MRNELLIATSMLFSLSSGGVQGACVTAPSCTEMGFTRTASECPKGSVKCPWNTSLVYCKDNSPTCKIGWIYYSDGTCSAKVDKTKTAWGVVVYITDEGKHGQVMAPWPVDADGNKSYSASMFWSTRYVDITSLPNYTTVSEASKDFNSCSNTSKLMARGKEYFAVLAATQYTLTTGGGKWCLPAAGIMTSIYNNQNAIREAITKLGGVHIPDCCVWSSSEYGINEAWVSSLINSYGLYYDKKDYEYQVRPVMEF